MLMFLFLIIILSLEATVGLPIFFLYISYKLINHRRNQSLIFLLFLIAFALAIFYTVSWPVIAGLLLILHYFAQRYHDKPLLNLLLFFIFNTIFFHLSKLQLNYFHFFHFLAFLFYVYKTKLKNYAP